MSRRRRNGENGSLELLLDTITNTFGGILFLAILVALLLRSTARQGETRRENGQPMSALEQAEVETRIENLRAQAESLQKRLESAARTADAAESAPVAELVAVTRELDEAIAARAESSSRTSANQREAAEAKARADTLEESMASAQNRFAEAEKRRTAAREEAAELSRAAVRLDRPPGSTVLVQTAVLPRLRPSRKKEVGIYVRFGRIFLMHAWRNGERLGPNVEQFVVSGDSPQVARPRPEKGIPIDEQTIDREIAGVLRPFPRDGYVIGFVVYDDSFAGFQVLKAAVVRMGYEYRPIPLTSGESVLDMGGTGEAQ